MSDALSLGSPLWLGIVAVMLIVMIGLFVVRSRSLFGESGRRRFDTTEIPADVAGAREYIVRDDRTGASLQFSTLEGHGRVLRLDVPRRHEQKDVELELFAVALRVTVEREGGACRIWTWPAVGPALATRIGAFARSRPDLELYDHLGVLYS
ncbi:hypothetical protein GCM10027416_00160 [Okibacterium endophyticum]